jgi:hypothetical protein
VKIKLGKHFVLIDKKDLPIFRRVHWHIAKDSTGDYRVFGRIRLSRFLCGLDATSNQVVDHKNHVTLDNRRSNLRPCTRAENQHNLRPMRTKKTYSEYKGVTYDKSRKKWMAAITLYGKRIGQNRFKTEQEAALSYNKLAKKYFGKFAYLNKIKESKNGTTSRTK